MDYRLMFDSSWLTAAHLAGKEHTVTIERVEQGELVAQKGKKSRKPVLHFQGKPLPLAVNKTIARVLARAFGNDTEAWVGKQVVLYPTHTEMGGETVDCIRLKLAANGGAA